MLTDHRERGRERGTEALTQERNIKWLPLVCAPTGDRTHNLWVYWMTFQPTEPHWPGLYQIFL